MTNYNLLRPGGDVYDPSGRMFGRIAGVSGDRFLLATPGVHVWIPNEWVTAVYSKAVTVSFSPGDLSRFKRTSSSRWLRR
jgi:hypothetical protein